MREILRIDLSDGPAVLIGTYHPPRHDATSKLGVLLVNFGQFDRAGPANLSVELAERLAEHGYPAFRFDLPGLGDSPGDLPADFETYWEFVEQGGQAAWTSKLVAALKQQFTLPGLLLGGLCGGALTAVFAAAHLNSQVQGLLLFDIQPIRSRPPLAKEAATATGPHQRESQESRIPSQPARTQLHKMTQWVRDKARHSRGHELLRHGRDWVVCIGATFAAPRFPRNANLPLISALEKLRDARLPMLVLLAPNANPQILKRDLFPLNKRRQVTIIDIAKTNHLFTSGGGKKAAVDQVQRWVTTQFPPADAPRRVFSCWFSRQLVWRIKQSARFAMTSAGRISVF